MDKYFNSFKEKVLFKIDNGEVLSEGELEEWFDWFDEIDEKHYSKHRWFQPVTTIFKIDDRYFQLDWEEGLTEYQPNHFPSQPFEVQREEHEEVVTIVSWKKVEKND